MCNAPRKQSVAAFSAMLIACCIAREHFVERIKLPRRMSEGDLSAAARCHQPIEDVIELNGLCRQASESATLLRIQSKAELLAQRVINGDIALAEFNTRIDYVRHWLELFTTTNERVQNAPFVWSQMETVEAFLDPQFVVR